MYPNIFVPINDSNASIRGLREAIKLATDHKAAIYASFTSSMNTCWTPITASKLTKTRCGSAGIRRSIGSRCNSQAGKGLAG